MYVSFASPRDGSGTHASSNEEAETSAPVEEDSPGPPAADEADFCWSRARKPGILSLAEGVG